MKVLRVSVFVCAFLAFAQQTAIQGTISDQSGAVIPSAIVRLTPSAGGPASSTISNQSGLYVFPSLAAAEYKLRVEAPGFTPAERALNVLVGQSLNIDFQLKPASAATTVDVVEGAGAVETSSSQVGGFVDANRMKNVPLNGRNWMELSMLVPGVTVNAVGNTPLGSVSGGRFQINVDGQQVTQNAAGTGFGQPQYSREAMSQFQVITNRFDATLGRSSQIQVNAQTKSGANDWHGSAYGYFRSDKFNAADPIAQRVLPFSNQQYGGTIGGKIITDKLFFFFAYEGERQPSTIFTTPNGFGGQNFSFPTNPSSTSYLSRVDWQLNASNRLSFRYSTFLFDNPFDGVGGAAHPSQGVIRTRKSHSGFVNWQSIISPALVNEVKYGINYFGWTNDPVVNSLEMRFSGGITIGGAYNFPQIFDQWTNQVRDDLFWLKGKHSIKLGGEYLSNNHTGYFQQNIRGLANPISIPANFDFASTFPVWNDPSTWKLGNVSPYVSTYTQGFGDFNFSIPRNIIGTWIQDDWKINKRLTFNLGLRYDNDLGIWSTPNLASGLTPPRGGDNNNFSPRVGFAFDLLGDRKTVIRGGAGLYYADIQANQVINQSIFNGETTLQVSVNKTATSNIDLTNPFNGATGEDFFNGTIPIPSQNLQLLGTPATTPYSFQSSLGFERNLGQDWTISGDFVYWRVYREWIRTDRNLFYNPTTGFNVNPSTGGRPNTAYSPIQDFITPSGIGAIYYGWQMEVQRRFARRYQVGTAYTVSKLKDNSTGPFYYANNQFDFGDEWGASVDDQRHTLNFNGSVQLPWGFQTSLFYHLGSGTAFASLSPTNPFAYTGTNSRTFLTNTTTFIDSQYLYPSKAPGYTNVVRDALRGKTINRVDFRVSKAIAIKEKWRITGIFEAFNLLNLQNYGAYASNVGLVTYGRPVQNTNLAYAARMLQFAARFDF